MGELLDPAHLRKRLVEIVPRKNRLLRALAPASARLRRPRVSRVISIVPSTRLACGMGQKARAGAVPVPAK